LLCEAVAKDLEKGGGRQKVVGGNDEIDKTIVNIGVD